MGVWLLQDSNSALNEYRTSQDDAPSVLNGLNLRSSPGPSQKLAIYFGKKFPRVGINNQINRNNADLRSCWDGFSLGSCLVGKR